MKFKSRQAVHDYLKNSKVYAGDKSLEVQKVLYKYGFHWLDLENIFVVPSYLFALPFLCIDNECINSFNSEHGFNRNNYKKLSADDILSIEIQEEKHVFKPFDRVLMSKNNSCWFPEFFKCYGYDSTEGNIISYMSISGCIALHCIPYEGNENLAFKPYNHEDGR